MPTPPRLRLQPLEDRSLPSAEIDPPTPVVVTGTDAHDIITLKRLAGDRVTVTVESFLDPEWTQPTGDPVRQFELRAGSGTLTHLPDDFSDPGLLTSSPTTGTISVDGGAGHDRIVILDVHKGFYVSGSHRTDDSAISVILVPVPVLRPGDELVGDTQQAGDYSAVSTLVPTHPFWLHDEQGGRWAVSHDLFTCEWRPIYRDVITEGDYMADGAVLGIRLLQAPDVPPVLYLPGDMAVAINLLVAEAEPDQFADAAGLDLVGDAEVFWDATDPWFDGEIGPDGWADDAGMSDLWVNWADEVPIDESDWGTGFGEDGSDWLAGEETDDWLVTDLES